MPGALTASLFNGAPMATIRKPRSGGVIGDRPTQAKPAAATTPETPATAPRQRWLVPAVAAAAVALAAIIFFATRGGSDTTPPDTDTVQIASVADTVRVEHPAQPAQPVAQQPVAQQQPQKQEASSNSNRQQQQPAAQQPAQQNYRTTPRNLDLQVTLNGEKYYFNQSEWANLSSDEQSRFSKRGVVIDYNGVRSFVVKLTMERHDSGFKSEYPIAFTWDEAMRWESSLGSGWRLPTKDEGKAMVDQYKAVCAAIKAFGGDEDPDWKYWTSTEYDASEVLYFSLRFCGYGYRTKRSTLCVRAVRAI